MGAVMWWCFLVLIGFVIWLVLHWAGLSTPVILLIAVLIAVLIELGCWATKERYRRGQERHL
jgi:uncharacterized membrane protein YhaH (DUF805 family)